MLDCGCEAMGYSEDMDFNTLVVMNRTFGTCTSERGRGLNGRQYICPNIDRLFRHTDADRTRKKYYTKRKEKLEGAPRVRS